MIDGEFVDRIAHLVREASGKIVEVDDEKYSTVKLHDPRHPDPEPAPFAMHTLSGLVDYLTANRDEINVADALVHVVGPTEVTVVGSLFGHFWQRYQYATAVPLVPGDRLGQWVDQEAFVIWLQAGFVETDDRAKVVKLAGTLTDEAVRTQADDGVTQKVTAKSGVSVVETSPVPNPVVLAPYRTFVEIEQPTSPFIFRVKRGSTGPLLALFEADGGAWRIAATASIHNYLVEALKDWKVIS